AGIIHWGIVIWHGAVSGGFRALYLSGAATRNEPDGSTRRWDGTNDVSPDRGNARAVLGGLARGGSRRRRTGFGQSSVGHHHVDGCCALWGRLVVGRRKIRG